MGQRIWFRFVLLGASAFVDPSTRGQSDIVGEVRTESGLHRTTFRVPEGVIQMNVPDDVSVGDTISGTVYAEPAGKNQKDQAKNAGEITGYVIELPGERAKTSGKRFQWSVPAKVTSGLIPVVLRNPKNKIVTRGNLPVNPAPGGPAPPEIDLPRGGQAGTFTSVWGPFGGAGDTSVRIGGKDAEVIAESPRKLIFQTPPDASGSSTIEVRKGGLTASGPFAVLRLQTGASKPALLAGETAVMNVTVSGLQGLDQPAFLVIVNHDPSTISLAGGPVQQIAIQPSDASNGTYTLARVLTGIKAGVYDITVAVTRGPSGSIPLERLASRTVDSWSRAQNVLFSAEARSLIVSDVTAARPQLDRLFTPQLGLRADPGTQLDWLVRDYCFDLRDRKLARGLAKSVPVRRPAFANAFVPQAKAVSLDVADVRGFSFSQFIGQLLSRLTPSDPFGDLLVSSQPDHQPITIDLATGTGFLSTRSFVLSVGKHTVKVGSCNLAVTVYANQQATVRCPP